MQRRSMRNVRARERRVLNTPNTLVVQGFGLVFLHIEPDRGERWSHDGGELHSFTRSIQRHLPLLSPLHPWTSVPHPKPHCFRRQWLRDDSVCCPGDVSLTRADISYCSITITVAVLTSLTVMDEPPQP